MALLHLLAGLADERGLTVSAAHVDHGLRDDSAEEAERVRRWTAELGVRCTLGGPAERPDPTQEALRRARYGVLRAVADQDGAERIATGHHADDQIETVLFRVLRGTGLRGLRGIPARRGRIVRPLLAFRRETIEAWVERRGIPHLRDPSNRDPRWSRARIRTRVLPALAEAWGEPVGEPLLALARHAARADRALDRHARRLLQEARDPPSEPADGEAAWREGALRLRRDPLAEADPETRARALRTAARERGVRLTRGGTRAAVEFISEGRSGGRVDLGDGLVLAREFDHLWLGRPSDSAPDSELSIPRPSSGAGQARIGGRRLAVRWRPDDPSAESVPAEGEGAEDGAHRLVLPADRIEFPLTVRGWRDGDRVRTESGTRKLKRLFNDRRVPLSRRPRIPTLVTASGRTLWAAGLARDPRSVPDDSEERLVVIVDDA